MDNKIAEKIYIISENGHPKELYVFVEDGPNYKVPYEFNVHDEFVQNFLNSKGFDINDPSFLTKSAEDGVFGIYDVNSKECKEIEKQYNDSYEDISSKDEESVVEEDLSNVEKDRLYTKKDIATAVGLAGASVLGLGGLAALGKLTEKQTDNNKTDVINDIDYDNATIDYLLNVLPTDNERRVFFETVDSVLESVNKITLDKEVFALDADKDAVLEFTTDEIISAMLVLNNYSQDELKEIFGNYELDSDKILSNYQSFATKMSIYAMNGKAPSTISNLITNEENRDWFESLENAIVEFNKEQNNQNADKLIRTFAYFYNHGINGVDNLENDESSLNGVKNLVLNMMRGYYDANTQNEYRKYLTVSTAPSDFDDKYRDNELSQVQKGEKLKFYLNEADNGVCTISVIKNNIESLVNNLRDGQSEYDMVIMNFSEAILDSGNIELAKDALEEGLSKDVLSAFDNASGKTKNILELYRTELAGIDSALPSYLQIVTALNREYGPFEEVKDDVLYNNRIRGVEKIDSITNSNSITKEEWNSMSKEEKKEYAKENGTVVSTKKENKKEKVDYEDLTPSEKQEADKQKEQLNEVQIGEETYKGDTTSAAKKGFEDATSYAEEKGAYNHADVYNKINPKYPTKVPTNGTLSNIVQVAYAFNNETITINDSQIQARLAKDVAAYKKTTKDEEMIKAYKSAWISAMNQKLSSAISQGKVLRKQAEEEYEKAQEAVNKKNESNTKGETTTKKEEQTANKKEEETTKDNTPVVTEKENENVVDPNLNPDIADSDEGFEDIYDEDFDGYTSLDEIDDNIIPYVDQVLEEETTKVYVKK